MELHNLNVRNAAENGKKIKSGFISTRHQQNFIYLHKRCMQKRQLYEHKLMSY